ncbi:type II secretion system F family protein [Rheinheimera riviphila]|uniref:Type II secretion system F family protein n=1 Tax=Rheinheimera riviphila TaxID=1834037 RepID=A0A437QF70_9GAMM|nr:type II secretion system F family protein [Rheinheimera riviphila]RVU33063.1 type II secretion system F family protein [Rheinheimera riviphila]
MANYRYAARDQNGQMQNGVIEAGSETTAADLLSRRLLIPLQIELIPDKSAPWWQMSLSQPKVGLMELIVFARQMYSLMRAGIPIIRAIRGLADSTASKALKLVLSDLADQLEKGRNLSVAMASHPKVFNRLIVSIVHVGENTGRLDDAFSQLSDYFEQEMETRKQIKQATRYPMFVLLAIVAAMVILNLFVIPQFANMFARFNAELPWATQVLLATSNFFINYWPFLLLSLLVATVALYRYLHTPNGSYRWSKLKLRLPIMGDIINRATLGRYARSFSLMLRAGVPLTSALSLVAEAVDNDFMAEKIREMRRNIERGESLVRVSGQSNLFTPLVMQMLAVGEETGQVDDMLQEVALFYEREVAFDLKSLTAKIEPILIVIVAVMVLILALGIFTPMWDMLNAYKKGS